MAPDEQRFSSKVDGWYFAIMAVVIVASGVPAALALLVGRWWMAVILLTPIAVVVGNLLSTSYVIAGDSLSVRCLLIRKTVPLALVTKLRASRDMRSSPALSLDRLEVLYGADSVLISPKDKTGFIQAVRAHQPSVTVEGLPDLQ